MFRDRAVRRGLYTKAHVFHISSTKTVAVYVPYWPDQTGPTVAVLSV